MFVLRFLNRISIFVVRRGGNLPSIVYEVDKETCDHAVDQDEEAHRNACEHAELAHASDDEVRTAEHLQQVLVISSRICMTKERQQNVVLDLLPFAFLHLLARLATAKMALLDSCAGNVLHSTGLNTAKHTATKSQQKTR